MADLTKDRDILQKLFKTCDKYPEKERYHALYVLSLGYLISEVANLFCKDEDTIRSWADKWTSERTASDKQRSGAPKKADDDIEDKIVGLVDENNPKKYGMNCSFWDCVELQKLFLLQGMPISDETIRRILIKNGFRYIKAGYEYALADKNERRKFLRNFAKILENFKGSILFFDEMSSKLHPKNGYTWTREEKPLVKTYSSHKRVSTMGAVNPRTGSRMTMITRRINKKSFLVCV